MVKEMICCQEINEYIDYYEKNKTKFNKERILLMENIVKPTLKRDDIFLMKKNIKIVLNIVKCIFTSYFRIKNLFMHLFLCMKMTFLFSELFLL